MPKLIPVGTLVRVLPSAVSEGAEFEQTNMETTARHGWLYFVEDNAGVNIRDPERSGPYSCRSLATGELGCAWLIEEIEEAPTDA